MNVEKLDSYPAGSRFEADVVVIGGGPAGLTIAREFIGSTTKILILESGLETEDAVHMELVRLESGDEPKGEASLNFRQAFHSHMATFDPKSQPFGIRTRVLGGAATHWPGKSATFDDIDFAERDWVPNSGWPISRDSLEPYFERAAHILNLGPNLYDERLWKLIRGRIKRPPLDQTKLSSFFWQFARSRLKHTEVMNFADEFRALDAKNIRTLINATVMHIDTNDAGDAFAGVDISTIEGVRHYAKAKICVLAAGGIENARLLLNSNRQHKEGLGNCHDVVGRYLMDHPGTRIGYFKKEDLKSAEYLGFYSIPHNGDLIMYTHGLAFSPEFQVREKLLNTAIYVLPEISPNDPFTAAKRLIRFKSTNLVADLWSAVSSIGPLSKGIGVKVFSAEWFPRFLKRYIVNLLMSINPSFVIREFHSKGVPHQLDRMGIHVITEQEPNRESRVMLSEHKDPLGSPRIIALWKISEAERRSVVRIGQLLQEELPKAGMPIPVLDDWIIENRPHEGTLVDMAHTIGTTRISDDPKAGVVDSQCMVHGVNGLYIAGGSVFPTSGHANPTLMIVSLAIRTADQIKRDLATTVKDVSAKSLAKG
jgi:choline dehydrogenase-like flavoprotein